MLMTIFQHQSTIVEALATPNNADFMTIFYQHVDHVHLQGIFLETRYCCTRITCSQSDQNLFLYVQHSCNLKFKCFIFLNNSYFLFVQACISRYGNIIDLTYFVALLVITISCCKASTLTSHQIIKSHRILYFLFSISHSSAHTY